jgi:hypothetical protein
MGNLVVSFKGDKNGYGEILMLNGSKYKGQCSDGKRNGNGKMTYLNGNVYVGEYVNTRKHGFGTLYNSTKQVVYEGYWIKGYKAEHQEYLTYQARKNIKKRIDENTRNGKSVSFAPSIFYFRQDEVHPHYAHPSDDDDDNSGDYDCDGDD